MENELISLDESLLYGRGLHKKCYLHPSDPDQCIKIAYNDEGREDLSREIAYWDVLNKRHKNYRILPKYYGAVMTTLGEGHLFELIRNYDGSQCRTLSDVLADEAFLSEHFDAIVQMLRTLKEEILVNEIITLAIFPHNILLQKVDETHCQVRMVNDMGSPCFFCIEYYSHYFARKKIRRHWDRFIASLHRKFPSETCEKLLASL